MKTNLLFLMMAFVLVFSSCDPVNDNINAPDENKPTPPEVVKPKGETHLFLTLHLNESSKVGKGSNLSVLKVKDGVASYEKLNDLYPQEYLRNDVEIKNNRVVIGLHKDFNVAGTNRQTNGAWFDISEGAHKILPLLPAGKGRYSYCIGNTVKVSNSGHVFYLSATNDADYYDQYRASLVRYNPKTDKLDAASDPSPFAVNQPEKKWDTEAGQYRSVFYPSSDGRFVYGVIETFGVSGGALHWDYKILFKYDFDQQKYTRLGEASDKDVFVLGITSDCNVLYYQNAGERKVLNVNTNTVTKLSISVGTGVSNTSKWNSSGYCSGATNNTIGIYNLVSDKKQVIKTPGRAEIAQFSADGKKIYFMLESSKGKYLCRTSNLSESAVIDTVCTLSSNVKEFLVIK